MSFRRVEHPPASVEVLGVGVRSSRRDGYDHVCIAVDGAQKRWHRETGEDAVAVAASIRMDRSLRTAAVMATVAHTEPRGCYHRARSLASLNSRLSGHVRLFHRIGAVAGAGGGVDGAEHSSTHANTTVIGAGRYGRGEHGGGRGDRLGQDAGVSAADRAQLESGGTAAATDAHRG
eukprot:ctg_949.g217